MRDMLCLGKAENLPPGEVRPTVSSVHQGFQETGQSAGTEAIFRWLDGADESPLIQQVKQQMLDVCPVRTGDQVLDVGCGLGHEVCRLARLTGPQGRVAGIDANPAMITEARRRGAGLGLPISFEVGDAHQVGLPGGSFDLCRTERVLRYVDRPEAVVTQMVRLTRPGGSVLAFDFDSDQTVVDAPDPALARRIVGVLDAAVPHPWIGRQLFRLFRDAGLRDVQWSRTPCAFLERPGSPSTSGSTRGQSTGPYKLVSSAPARRPHGGQAWNRPGRPRRSSPRSWDSSPLAAKHRQQADRDR